jgi:hypothetical protein
MVQSRSGDAFGPTLNRMFTILGAFWVLAFLTLVHALFRTRQHPRPRGPLRHRLSVPPASQSVERPSDATTLKKSA